MTTRDVEVTGNAPVKMCRKKVMCGMQKHSQSCNGHVKYLAITFIYNIDKKDIILSI